jgi:hypothetical protein
MARWAWTLIFTEACGFMGGGGFHVQVVRVALGLGCDHAPGVFFVELILGTDLSP